jgi:hypothetical protein
MHALAENRGQPMTKISEVVKLKTGYANFVELPREIFIQ